MALVKIEEIEKQLGKILDDFNHEVNLENVKAVNKTATETAKYLKEKSPKSKRKTSGQYARSWGVKRGNIARLGYSAYVKLKKPHYRLAHLLEYGHAKKNGGRTRAIVHIGPAEKFAKTLYLENLKKGVEKIK